MPRATSNTEAQDHFAEVLRHLGTRPKMYTFDGSLRQAVVYIEGYLRGSGLSQGQYNLESGMQPFGRWLAARCGASPDQPWHLSLLEHCGGDEGRAVQQLWPLYEEYLTDSRERSLRE